jgi:hypothetical protein
MHAAPTYSTLNRASQAPACTVTSCRVLISCWLNSSPRLPPNKNLHCCKEADFGIFCTYLPYLIYPNLPYPCQCAYLIAFPLRVRTSACVSIRLCGDMPRKAIFMVMVPAERTPDLRSRTRPAFVMAGPCEVIFSVRPK